MTVKIGKVGFLWNSEWFSHLGPRRPSWHPIFDPRRKVYQHTELISCEVTIPYPIVWMYGMVPCNISEGFVTWGLVDDFQLFQLIFGFRIHWTYSHHPWKERKMIFEKPLWLWNPCLIFQGLPHSTNVLRILIYTNGWKILTVNSGT